MKRTNKLHIPTAKQLIIWLTTIVFAINSCPIAWATPSVVAVPIAARPANGKAPNNSHTRTGPHRLQHIEPKLVFSDNPTDQEICNARVFQQPLAPMSGQAVTSENKALAKALVAFHAKHDDEDLIDLEQFVSKFPKSRWRAAVELNAGLIRFQTGHLTESIALLDSAWRLSESEKASLQKAVADRAIAKLLLIEARLGMQDDLHKRFAQIGKRSFFGFDEQMIEASRGGMIMMSKDPACSFKCGPYALNSILNAEKKQVGLDPIVKKASSTKDGTNLWQVKHWADQLGLKLQAAKRAPGAEFIAPSVMHWKLGHFAAIVAKENDRVRIEDRTFDSDCRLAPKTSTLDKETDGYFLVPAGPLPKGWSKVDEDEAKLVWGKGFTYWWFDGNPGNPPCPPGTCCIGMARAATSAMNATLNIQDTPLSYQPPLGAAINFSVSYQHMETNQPGTFTFTNLGQDWVFNWLSYLTIDMSTQAATIRLPGGNSEIVTPVMGVYPPDVFSQAVLTYIGTNDYQRALPDGTIEVFNQPDGSGNIFMSEVIDPQGNSVLIQYDANFRITSITDAINQVSTISYVSNTIGNVGFYKIASVTDPFGRSCSFGYDSTTTKLISITDVVGLVSQFGYDTSSTFINLMTTPYGSTSFYRYTPTGSSGYARGLKTNFPDGTSALVESWVGYNRATYFWDREAMQLYPLDAIEHNYTHCSTTGWMQSGTLGQLPVVASTSQPLESTGNVVYAYPGQGGDQTLGPLNRPSEITKFLGPQIGNVTIGGTVTTGDVVEVNVGYTGWITYTVQSGDSLESIASSLAANINSNSAVQSVGVVATSANNIVSISPNVYTADYRFNTPVFVATSGGATETLNLESEAKQFEMISFSGTITPGNTLSIEMGDNFLAPQIANYTILSGDTYSSIASGIAAAINANTSLAAVGTVATAASNVVNIVTYTPGHMVYSINNNAGLTVAARDPSSGSMQEWFYQYNSLGHVTQAIDPVGRTFTYEYDANNIDLLQITETQGTDNFLIGSWTYNSQHRPLTYTDGSGQETQYAYNSSGQLITLTDANSKVTTLTYSGTCPATIGGSKTTGNVLTLTVHDTGLGGGQETDSYTVLSGDTLSSIAAGLAAAINADTSLQAIGVSASVSGTSITLTSTSVNVTTYTESISGGATETITLGTNTFGYLTMIDGPLSGSDDVTAFSYDSFGRLSQRTDSEGYTLAFSYDNANRPTQTSFPDGTTEQTTYDKLDAVLRKDRIGRWTQDSFDSLDQIAFEIDPLGRKTQYSWCACGSLESLTDASGNVTTWQHDVQGRPVLKTYPDDTTVSYTYEENSSRLRSKTDALGQITFYTYNADNTPFQASYKNAVNPTATVTYVFDPNFNRISSVQKNDWGTLSYTYNAYIVPSGSPTTGGGMLQKVHNDVIANSDITYSFDVLGRTTNRSINGGSNSINWGYDAMSRITSEANALGTFNYAYVDDVSGSSKGTLRLASISYPNSQVTNFGWFGNTGDQRLQQIQNLNPSGAVLSQFNYGYDPAGEITQWQQQQNGNNQFFNLGYDLAGQLTSAQVGSGSPQAPFGQEFHYGYDSASNRTSVQQGLLQTVRIAGSKTTADVLTIQVNDPALSGGTESVNYTVLSGDTLSTITAGLAAAITADANLQAIGVNAAANSTTLLIRSVSPNITTYASSTSGGATETIAFGIFKNGIELASIGGTKTTGDVLTLKVLDAGLGGGSESVTYTVLSGDTLTSIATGLKSAVNADTSLSTAGITATSASTVVAISSTSKNATTYMESVSSGATETIGLSVNQNGPQLAVVGGTKSTSDILTIKVFDPALSGGSESIAYTVLSGDVLTSIATGLKSAINADTNLAAAGITATSSGVVVTCQSNSPNVTAYRQSFSSGSTESIAFTLQPNSRTTVAIGGTKTTGNVLSLVTFDPALSGGKEAVTYTVLSGDTLSSIAAGLASAVNGDSNLSAVGVSASSTSTVITLTSTSTNPTTYSQSVSAGSTETVVIAPSIGVQQAAFNNVNELTSLISGGATSFQASASKPVASSKISTQVVNVAAAMPSSIPEISSSVAGTPTETLTMTPEPDWYPSNMVWAFNVGGSATVGDTVSLTMFDTRMSEGQRTVSYTLKSGDPLWYVAYYLCQAIDNDGKFTGIGIIGDDYNAAQFFVADGENLQAPSNAFSWTITSPGTETVSLGVASDDNASATVAGTVTTGDVVSLVVDDASLVNGPETVSYTVLGGDTTTSIATGLKSAINADTNLQAVGVGARSSSAVVTVGPFTYYTTSVTGSSTETLTLGTTVRGNVPITVSGSPTTGDVVSVIAHNQSLSGGTETASDTVLSTDNLLSIAQGLSAAINADTNLQALGVTAPSQSTLAWAQSLSGSAQVPQGGSLASVNAVDGGSNSKTNVEAMNVSSGSATTLTFDADGNMTTDQNGNTLKWDAANRLIEIDYPGSGNKSVFTYEGFSRNVMIQEYVSSSLTSTKQFIWCGNERCEQRDVSSTVTAQFFEPGETISGTKYFFIKDHLGSVKQMADNSGALQSDRSYDPFGRVTINSESVTPDFGYAGYYLHSRSGLNLTKHRCYSPGTGRWINRDPSSPDANRYSYVHNSPVCFVDPLGLAAVPPGGSNGGGGSGNNSNGKKPPGEEEPPPPEDDQSKDGSSKNPYLDCVLAALDSFLKKPGIRKRPDNQDPRRQSKNCKRIYHADDLAAFLDALADCLMKEQARQKQQQEDRLLDEYWGKVVDELWKHMDDKYGI